MRITGSCTHLFTRSGTRKGWAAFAAAVLLTVAAGRSFSADAPEDWKAPVRAQKKSNPVLSDAASIAAGKVTYTGNCLACHGAAGKGDGPAAAACNPRPHDLSEPKIASQTDGELFWKVTEGRKPMPSYQKLLSDTERWQVINYIRSLGAKPASPK